VNRVWGLSRNYQPQFLLNFTGLDGYNTALHMLASTEDTSSVRSDATRLRLFEHHSSVGQGTFPLFVGCLRCTLAGWPTAALAAPRLRFSFSSAPAAAAAAAAVSRDDAAGLARVSAGARGCSSARQSTPPAAAARATAAAAAFASVAVYCRTSGLTAAGAATTTAVGRTTPPASEVAALLVDGLVGTALSLVWARNVQRMDLHAASATSSTTAESVGWVRSPRACAHVTPQTTELHGVVGPSLLEDVARLDILQRERSRENHSPAFDARRVVVGVAAQ
jgi:hypothetical protein